MDANAQAMCANAVQAAAHEKAGDTTGAKVLRRAAETAGTNSAVIEVRRIADLVDAADRMAAWCKENLPNVTAAPVAKPSPKKSTAKPNPKKTTKKPAPEDQPEPVRDVAPGAFCSPAGATGTHNGRVYTCKGPGQARWRR